MAEPYKVLNFPDEGLKREGHAVTDFGETTQNIIDRMLATLERDHAIGAIAFAATQLDMPDPPAITVISHHITGEDTDLCLVNPEIIEKKGDVRAKESCMSVYCDHFSGAVKRAKQVVVTGQDREGAPLRIEARNLYARCLQHEIDHLHKTIYLDRLPDNKKRSIIKAINQYLAVKHQTHS